MLPLPAPASACSCAEPLPTPGFGRTPVPQEEASERGLVSVFHASEAWDPQAGALSAWQVKDSEGRWQGVALREGEVAVTLGHTMQHACTGLLQPGCHRVVGDPYAGSGGFGGPHTRSNSDSDSNSSTAGTRRQRQQQPTQGRTQLCFELRPRPAAVLDLRPQLEAAGHTVSSRWGAIAAGGAVHASLAACACCAGCLPRGLLRYALLSFPCTCCCRCHLPTTASLATFLLPTASSHPRTALLLPGFLPCLSAA